MYEARQNKEKVSRRIDNPTKKDDLRFHTGGYPIQRVLYFVGENTDKNFEDMKKLVVEPKYEVCLSKKPTNDNVQQLIVDLSKIPELPIGLLLLDKVANSQNIVLLGNRKNDSDKSKDEQSPNARKISNEVANNILKDGTNLLVNKSSDETDKNVFVNMPLELPSHYVIEENKNASSHPIVKNIKNELRHITLAHELIHAERILSGKYKDKNLKKKHFVAGINKETPSDIKEEEIETVGLPTTFQDSFDSNFLGNYDFTENKIRNSLGLPRRVAYDETTLAALNSKETSEEREISLGSDSYTLKKRRNSLQ